VTKVLFAVAFCTLLSTLGQAVTWQRITFPDGTNNGPVAMNDIGDLLSSTCYVRSHINGTFEQVTNQYPDVLTCTGINNAGTVVGTEVSPDGTSYSYGIEFPNYGNGTAQLIIYPNTVHTYVNGINNFGTIVGSYNHLDGNGNPTSSGFIYREPLPYRPVYQPIYGSDLLAILGLSGINDDGTFIGSGGDYYNPNVMFIANTNGPAVQINTPGAELPGDGDTFVIAGINIHGSIVGSYVQSLVPGPVGVLIENGVTRYLQPPDGGFVQSNAIDKWGNIAGSAQETRDGNYGFVRWVKCTPKVGCK